jgi:hypothetical protein
MSIVATKVSTESGRAADGTDAVLYKDTVVKDKDLGRHGRLILNATGDTATATATATSGPSSQEIKGTTGILSKCKRVVEFGAGHRRHQRKQFPY